MIIALVILIPLCILALWVFFHFSPRTVAAKQRIIKVYNITVLVMSIVLCALFSYNTYSNMIDTTDREWWPILSTLGSLFIFSTVLLISATIRSFIFQRKEEAK
ncbi:hypothetical protein ACFL3D_03635 [Candidatus Omnitrophota bacterium]